MPFQHQIYEVREIKIKIARYTDDNSSDIENLAKKMCVFSSSRQIDSAASSNASVIMQTISKGVLQPIW